MLFCSTTFLGFFLIVFCAYWAVPWHRARVYALLAASIYFYATWNKWLALLLVVTSLGDYLIARGMEALPSPRLRRLLLLTSIVGNLGLLCYFKYANFFLQSLEEAVVGLGFHVSLPVLKVILPIGISFYTFEAINYTVDVYLRKIKATRDFAHFLLFILFFPHLIAGPIVRAGQFLPQVARRKHWSWLRAHTGVMLILLGVVKKLAIADRMVGYVDPVFADPASFGTAALWLAAFAYAIQVYCDFSGYSDMALGLAHLFGFHLAVNFNMPFLSPNFSEFWKRWHISLSTWIRDYVFAPLGGSRGTRLQTYRNLLVTFTLCGLWHGAGWNFVGWGVVTGLCLIGHSAFREWAKQHPGVTAALESGPGTTLRIAITFVTFCLTLVVFRCPELSDSLSMLTRMLTPAAGAALTLQAHGLYLTFIVVALGHYLGRHDRGRRLWDRLPAPVTGLAFGAALTLALILAPGASQAFIYFQF
jgi:alginate O-acetyltransferase complex protein AlgI